MRVSADVSVCMCVRMGVRVGVYVWMDVSKQVYKMLNLCKKLTEIRATARVFAVQYMLNVMCGMIIC